MRFKSGVELFPGMGEHVRVCVFRGVHEPGCVIKIFSQSGLDIATSMHSCHEIARINVNLPTIKL